MGLRLGILVVATLLVSLTGCSRSSDRHPGQPPVPPAVPVPADQPAPVLSAVTPNDPTIAAVRAMLDEPARSNARFIGKTVQAGGQTLTLLYVVGDGLCIPEGCDLFVFRRTGDAFEQVGDIGFVHRPIRLLASTTNGMPNLGIAVTVDGGSGSKVGGGARHAPNEVLLPFLNDHYVGAPADYGARPSGNPAGVVVISPEDVPLEAPGSASGQIGIIGAVDNPAALRAFLQNLSAESRQAPPGTVVARTVDGGAAYPRITLVYMTDQGWCGSGGCTLFVLRPGAQGLTLLSRTTINNPPVRLLNTRSHGMPDISVQVRSDYYPGPGPKFVALSFDGRTYPLNPTTPPARLLPGEPEGEILISERDVYDAFRR